MEIDKDTIPQITIKETMEPEDKELVAILQYVSNENGWGKVLNATADTPIIKQNDNIIYTTINFNCELENSLIKKITLTTKGHINNSMYWIEEIIIEEE